MWAIYQTLVIKEVLTKHDLMQGFQEHKGQVFPIFKVLSDSIIRELANPKREPFLSQILKHRFLFEKGLEHL